MSEYVLESERFYFRNGTWYDENFIEVPMVLASKLRMKFGKGRKITDKKCRSGNSYHYNNWNGIYILPGSFGSGKRR